MDPTLRGQLGELHQRELRLEAEERRQAARLPKAQPLRARGGRFLATLTQSLLPVGGVKPKAVPGDPLPVAAVTVAGECGHPLSLPLGHDCAPHPSGQTVSCAHGAFVTARCAGSGKP